MQGAGKMEVPVTRLPRSALMRTKQKRGLTVAHNMPLKIWRNVDTKEVISGGHEPPNPHDWAQVIRDADGCGYTTVKEAAPRPAPEITGYRQLSVLELELVNRIKKHAEETRTLVEELEKHGSQRDGGRHTPVLQVDKRWIAVARTNLQQGYMALVRSITRPETF